LLSETLSFLSGHGSVRRLANGEREKLASKISTLGKFYVFGSNGRANFCKIKFDKVWDPAYTQNMINLELRKLGLKEKEVNVYLAALELGFNSVQNIAQKADISRPTAYEIIKELIAKGLMKEVKRQGAIQGERTFFAAESPDNLLGLLRVQKREIEEKEREFVRIISALRAKYNIAGQSEIRSFTGKNELEVLLDDFSQSQTANIYFICADQNILKHWHDKLSEIKKRLGEIKLKEIKKDIPGNLIIYDKIIYLFSPNKALLIENKLIVELIKSLL